MSKWTNVDSQEQMWRDGDYDYLDDSLISVRGPIVSHLVHRFGQKIRGCKRASLNILDVGAGSGMIFWNLLDGLRCYTHNDVSQTAEDRFVGSVPADSPVKLLFGKIEDVVEDREFNVILGLGLVPEMITPDTMSALVANNLEVGGVCILEAHTQNFKAYEGVCSEFFKGEIHYDVYDSHFERGEMKTSPARHRRIRALVKRPDQLRGAA